MCKAKTHTEFKVPSLARGKNMIEVTLTEVALFIWGIGATAFALKFNHELNMTKFLIHKLVTEEKVRNDLVEAYNKFAKGRQA
jgi:hypothetical protein